MKNKSFAKINLFFASIKKSVASFRRKFLKPFWQKFSEKLPRTSRFLTSRTNLKNLMFILKFGAIILAGIVSVWYIFGKQYGAESAEFIRLHPEITGYSTLIMIFVAFLFFGIIGNVVWSIGALFSIITVVMFINEEKMRSRNTPFMIEDLSMTSEAGSLTDMINWTNLFWALFTIAAILVVCFFINKLLKKIPHHKFSKKYKYLAQIIIVTSSITLLSYHTDFLRTKLSDQGKTTVRVDWLNSTIDFTNPAYNYLENGYIVGTISALQSNAQKKPEGYSKAKIQEIVEKYTKLANQENKNRQNNISDKKVNIVFIMSESFADPAKIKHIYNYGNTDPIPYTRSIMEKYSSGQATTAEYGGGTANVEFEALTGLSNYFLNTIPYTSLVSGNSSVPSIAKTLKSNGYSTTAIHPYAKTMYKRNLVYPNLGIDNFIGLDTMKNPTKLENSRYVSDQSAFNQVIETLNQTDGADFVHLVTMQNHMPYSGGTYNTRSFPIMNISGKDSDVVAWETYLEGINKSDEALKNFIEKIQTSDEKTMVVFWGDHWPGIAEPLFENYQEKNDVQRTPLFIYSNFQTDKKSLGITSLNYLQVKVLDQIGAKLSPFQQLLLENSKNNLALTKKETINKTEALSDYEMIEYDILSGGKYSLGDFYGYEN